MKVHEIMTAHARCVAPENTLVEAAGLMRELDVGVLPVCENDRVAGIVTDRDIVLRGVADGRDAYSATVREVMSEGVFHVFADQEVEAAARIMEEKQVRRLPVLNREKRLVGIVSLGDMAVSSNPAFSGEALREVSESPEQRMRGGLTASSARDRGRDRMAESPVGSRWIPARARQTGGRGRKSNTRGRRPAAGGEKRGAGTTGKGAGRGRSARASSAKTRSRQSAAGGSRGAAQNGARGRSRKTAARAAG